MRNEEGKAAAMEVGHTKWSPERGAPVGGMPSGRRGVWDVEDHGVEEAPGDAAPVEGRAP